jgi:hypothetical protein
VSSAHRQEDLDETIHAAMRVFESWA